MRAARRLAWPLLFWDAGKHRLGAPVRVLLSFENLASPGGTETYTLTVARELDRLGHDVAIYSPNLGAMAGLARARGLRVIGANELPRSVDLLICSDTATCHELAGRCRDAVRIYVAHSVDFVLLQTPPQLPDRCAAVVVLNDRVRRAIEARGWHAPIVRLRQPIDLTRFAGLGSGAEARTVLVLTNTVKGSRARLIEEACRANGLDVRWIGATSEPTPSPELAIAGSKLVIGLGRCALEAMAAGRATYVYGVIGGDGWVTPDSYPAMEADGFAGTALSDVVIDGDRLADHLGRWDETMGELNRDLVAAHHTAREHAVELVNLARRLEALPLVEASPGEEMAYLVRHQWQTEFRAIGNLAEADRLRRLLAQAETNLAQAETNLAQAETNLAQAETNLARMEDAARVATESLHALQSTRRYRLACRIASPLDRMRARLGIGR
jgi:hypothetical protein